MHILLTYHSHNIVINIYSSDHKNRNTFITKIKDTWADFEKDGEPRNQVGSDKELNVFFTMYSSHVADDARLDYASPPDYPNTDHQRADNQGSQSYPFPIKKNRIHLVKVPLDQLSNFDSCIFQLQKLCLHFLCCFHSNLFCDTNPLLNIWSTCFINIVQNKKILRFKGITTSVGSCMRVYKTIVRILNY